MARSANQAHSGRNGFTLIEVLVAIAILGVLMSAVMIAFKSTTDTVQITNEKTAVTKSLRRTSEFLQRELAQAIINNNRPDGEQVYFEIKQIPVPGIKPPVYEQSVLRFGCSTERGPAEIGYQVHASSNSWADYELCRMHRTENMWKYSAERNWPLLDFEKEDVEPFSENIIGFQVEFWSSKYGKWVLGNWESIQRNAMPKRLKIKLTSVTRSQAKEATVRKTARIKDMPRANVEVQEVEVTLQQAK